MKLREEIARLIEYKSTDPATDELIQLIKQWALEMVGEDKEGPIELPDVPGLKLDDLESFTRNKEKNEIRQRIEESTK